VTDGAPIRIVLDSTAIVAFAHGSDDVGEVIRELADEGNHFAVPSVCLIEAALHLEPSLWPVAAVLLAHPRAVRLESPPDWRDVAAVAKDLGSQTRAVPLWWADAYDGYVLSAEPDRFGLYADRVIGF
jgi:hypothetical protein